jgi:prefoldin beta subunit
MVQDIREMVNEFEKQRQMLMSVSMQKQQLQASINGLEISLKELENTKESKVFKAAGAILVSRDTKEVKKELAEQKESTELRMKTLDKQEKNLVEKLNTLKTQIETAAKTPDSSAGDATVISSKK